MRFLILILILSSLVYSQNKIYLIDDFEDIGQWTFIKSDGVDIKASLDNGSRQS